MALETVMDMFKNLGPRVILVVEYGKLSGLVTVKDVLKRIAMQEKAEAAARSASLPTNSVANVEGFGGGELEILLKEAYEWAQDRWAVVAPHADRLVARFGMGGTGRRGRRQQQGERRYAHLRQSTEDRYDDTEGDTQDVALGATSSSQQQRQKKTTPEQQQFVLGADEE
ncbi:hypothetical protein [Sporisorium scitamineum]|nr:hypothetical protein [Sporisorium scitamineum]